MNEQSLVPTSRNPGYLIPSDAPLLMPRIIRHNLSWHRKKIRHATFSKQCRALAKIDWNQLKPELRDAAERLFRVVEARTQILFAFGPEVLRVETFVRMAEYRENWIRQAEDWYPTPGDEPLAQYYSLLNHLFLKYPMPDYFRKAWMQAGPLRSRARDWFCQIAGGENIRALATLPTKLTARAAHHTMTAPENLTIEQALRYGQVLAFGGSEELAGEIVRSRIGENFNHDHLWLKLIEKLAREPRFASWEAPIVIDYIHYLSLDHDSQQPEGILNNNHIIEIAKRARIFWRETAEHAAQAYEDKGLVEFGHQSVRNHLLRRMTRKWRPSETYRPATIRGEDGIVWRISELCSEFELQREGSRMHHCVVLYAGDCLRGEYSIWTVTDPSGKHFATIRVDHKYKDIDEARAAFNHQPIDDVLAVIRTWARHNKLDDDWIVDTFGYRKRPDLELVG